MMMCHINHTVAAGELCPPCPPRTDVISDGEAKNLLGCVSRGDGVLPLLLRSLPVGSIVCFQASSVSLLGPFGTGQDQRAIPNCAVVLAATHQSRRSLNALASEALARFLQIPSSGSCLAARPHQKRRAGPQKCFGHALALRP
jgi:hypothetical protein